MTDESTKTTTEENTFDDSALGECEDLEAAADVALKQLEQGGDEDEAEQVDYKEDDVESIAQDEGVTLEAEDGVPDDEEESLESMKRRVEEMEAEAKKIEAMQTAAEQSATNAPSQIAVGPEADAASIYVGQVDYASKPEELQTFFASCGTVQRVTIVSDKWTGQPKGFAYVQFRSPEAVANAVLLDGTEFKGRKLKIAAKRTNIHGYNRGRPRGRGGYSRYRGRYRGYGSYYRGRSRYRYRGYRGNYHHY